MSKPGITFVDFPVLGPSFARRIIVKNDVERRKDNIERRAYEDSEKRY